jgi:hypothetical protein
MSSSSESGFTLSANVTPQNHTVSDSPSPQMSWRASVALALGHAVLLAVVILAWRHVHIASRLILLVLAVAWIWLLASALNRLRVPYGTWIKVVGWAWIATASVLFALGLLMVSTWQPKGRVQVDGKLIAGYVGCDGATTDPCIIVQQEWPILPGVAAKKVLYSRAGRDFSMEPESDRTVRIHATAFFGETQELAEETTVVITRWPWE